MKWTFVSVAMPVLFLGGFVMCAIGGLSEVLWIRGLLPGVGGVCLGIVLAYVFSDLGLRKG